VNKRPEPRILIQRIMTVWTKKSRGAPGSVRRNAVPDAVILPLRRFPQNDFVLLEHQITFHENTGFENPSEAASVLQSLGEQNAKRYGCVNVHSTVDGLQISWNYEPLDAGLPDRTRANWTSSLSLNRWVRVTYNGRYSLDWEGGWWYEKKVVNIGLFDNPTERVFLEANPIMILDRTAILY